MSYVILEHGFARVRCATCGDELLVAFSCKNRGVCPSCSARRMADTAAYLRDNRMELLQVVVLGVVEGLTEFVPVSSTGHFILVQRWLGLSGPAVNAYVVVIQLGALLAAVFYYRRTLLGTTQGLFMGQPAPGASS